VDLRILFVEDSADDAELMIRRLREAGFEPRWQRVGTETELREALAGEGWELALVDYDLPGFGGPQALAVLAEVAPDLPAITVSGAIDEETAVTTIKAGAVDYVLKDNLIRLAPAVRRAVDGAELRRQHRRSEESARLALFAVEHASLSILAVASDGTILHANEFACEEFGARHEDIAGAKIWDFDDYVSAATWPDYWEALERSHVMEFEVERVGSDGRCRIIDVTVNLLEGADSLISYGRDITVRKQAHDAIRESEERLRDITFSMADWVWEVDENGVYTYSSQKGAELFGSSAEDIVGKTPFDFMPPDEAQRVGAIFAGIVADKAPIKDLENWNITRNGDRICLLTNGVPMLDDDGNLRGYRGVDKDITARKQAEEELRRHAAQLRRTLEGAVLAMSHVVETRDPYTAGHERRVAELAVAMAAEMDLDPEVRETLRLAGLIHDIGKIAVPAEILAKPGRLSEAEFNLIKQHPQSGFEILVAIDFGRPVAEIVLQHHERLDGSGYPRALSAAEVLPEARILAVADVVEAMSSHRPYRAALGMAAALAEVREHAGLKYDAAAVAACVRLVEERGFEFTP
jgi:PAS domain S-box-containing protein/putative nucleotidyltransferase with HDIG domain